MKYDIQERLVNFASDSIDWIELQPDRLAVRILSGQLIRSVTSSALNYGEALGSESSRDYRHKMSICLKELRETHISLSILKNRKYIIKNNLSALAKENDELIRIFVSSIKTSLKNDSTK